MYESVYYIPKESLTSADTAMLFGFAEVLTSVLEQRKQRVKIELVDQGSHYTVELDRPLREDDFRTTQEVAPYLVNKAFPRPADLPGLRVRDVDQEWERFHRYLEQREQLRKAGKVGTELEQLLAGSAPEPDWTVVTYLSDNKMGAQKSYNRLIEQWQRSNDHFGDLNLRTLFQMFANPMVDWRAVAKTWKKAVKGSDFAEMETASQLLNPHTGKGVNRVKADGVNMDNESAFWLAEYLKAVGIWQAAAPTKASNADLRKTYVLVPNRIDYLYHKEVFAKFRERFYNDSAVKQDILAALLYTETLLRHSVAADRVQIFGGGSIAKLVRGMNVVTYQSLSTHTYTTMNIAFLGLPDWMPHIRTSADAELLIEIVQEHMERIRAIDEDRSDGYALLQLYRDFVSGNYLEAFFEFCGGYSSYLLREIKRGAFYVKPFTEMNLRRLFEMATVSQPLSPILQDEGFRNVARAIRLSTVSALYLGKRSRFDVRYGLSHELMRQAQYPDEFAQALAEFMQSYNDESMRVYKRTKGKARRKLITTKDIEAIMALVDQHGSKTVCNLLVAFGYARDPKEEADDEQGLAGEHEEQAGLAEIV